MSRQVIIICPFVPFWKLELEAGHHETMRGEYARNTMRRKERSMHGRIEKYAYIGSNQVVQVPDGNGPIQNSLVKTKTRTKLFFKIRGKGMVIGGHIMIFTPLVHWSSSPSRSYRWLRRAWKIRLRQYANAIMNSDHQRSELKEERTATEAPNYFSPKFRIECCVVVWNPDEEN